ASGPPRSLRPARGHPFPRIPPALRREWASHMPQYYTLEEAAQLLGVTPDELKRMADRNEVRPFRDRGTMRFRGPEIEEMARRRGRGSDPELQPGEAQRPRAADSPPPKKKAPEDSGNVFDFDLSGDDSDEVELGKDPAASGPSSSGRSKPSSSGKNKPG